MNKDPRTVWSSLKAPGIGALLGLASVVVATACGDAFNTDCHVTHTCPSSGGTANVGGDEAGSGQVGGELAVDEPVGGNGANSGGSDGTDPIQDLKCKDDADCDDGDACNGTETCTGARCRLGDPVECDVGMSCSAKAGGACVFDSAAPWIIYTADQEKVGVQEAYGVKSDLLGKMTPVKLNPPLLKGWHVDGFRWSPDGMSVAIVAVNAGRTLSSVYLVRLGEGLPETPVDLTKDLAPSAASGVVWFPGGGRLLFIRDDGPHIVDIRGSAIVEQRIEISWYTRFFFKSDDELEYWLPDDSTSTVELGRVRRVGSTWSVEPVIKGVKTTEGVFLINDRTAWEYKTYKAGVGDTIWHLATTPGSSPIGVAGPADDVSLLVSPDSARFLLATTAGAVSTVFGGPARDLTAPSVLKKNQALKSRDILGSWAPDSSRAITFQKGGSFGRQLVLYNPDLAQKWEVLPLLQSDDKEQDGSPLWAPDSSIVAVTSRTGPSSMVTVNLVASSANHVAIDDALWAQPASFSPGGDYFVYAKSDDGVTTRAAYVDLRQGLAKAGTPITLAPSAFADLDFARTSLEAVYVEVSSCSYLDLSGDAAVSPVVVNRGGTVTWCEIQKLPRQ